MDCSASTIQPPVPPLWSREKTKKASSLVIVPSSSPKPFPMDPKKASSTKRKSSPPIEVRLDHSGRDEDVDMESIPLMDIKTMEELTLDYSAQQKQLILLQEELATYKMENSKMLQNHLFDRFEGIKKHEVMTQFSCKWFAIMGVCHLLFYFVYYVWRKGSQAVLDDDETEARSIVTDGLLQVSMYSMAYLFIVLFDIFWLLVCPDRVRCDRTTAHTHVIVAAHRAHESLEEMLPTVLQTFSPECVWVADNGYHDVEAEALCRRLGVNYEFNEVGNKANALVVVARKIKRCHGESVKNVVLLDDDTELASDFFVRHDLLADPRVGGYCVGIAINREKGGCNIWEIAIDFEYRAISHAFGARATCASMPFCHGICAVYKLDLMIEMYSKNWSLPGGLPFGEDGYAGLDYRVAGYKLLQDNANVVLTYCPRQFFPPLFNNGRVQGYGASSLWKQRACRWFLSWPRQLPLEIWLFLTYNAGSWYGNIQYRVYFLWWLFLNCVSVGWIPYMFFVWIKKESWILVLLLKAMLTVTGVLVAILRILAFPPKLRKGIHPLAPLCSPILGVANSVLRFFGFLFSLYWFIPFYRVNNLKVLGGDEDVDDGSTDDLEHGLDSEREEPTDTEGPTDSEDGANNSVESSPTCGDNESESRCLQPVHRVIRDESQIRDGDDENDAEAPSLASPSERSSSIHRQPWRSLSVPRRQT